MEGTVVLHGPTALILSFGAGILSFLSPCTLPLIPGYLAYVSGLGYEEVQARENVGLVLRSAVLFVVGFSLVFVAQGATLSYIGSVVLSHRETLTRIAGIFIILMALFLLGVLRVPILSMDRRMHVARDLGTWTALPLGLAFGFSWTPCLGPILAAIDTMALTERSAEQGALLLFVYSLGLGVPFLAVALFAGRAFHSLAWFKRHYRAFNLAGAAVLLVMGVFLVMDRWTELLGPIMRWYAQLNLPV